MVVLSGGGIQAYPFTPYCGAPPSPGDLLFRWNLDPFLVAVLLAILVVHARFVGAESGERGRAWVFRLGWVLGVAALISPLCPLSVSLFSARVGQHMFLTTIVAPLIAVGLPQRWAAWSARAIPAWAAALAFGAALWFWHAPGPYTDTFRSDVTYWVMHPTTLGAAFVLWTVIVRGEPGRVIDKVAALAITSLQMGVLGAVITFAPRALYPPHELTAWAWGLSPLSDQQFGGAIMWVPAGIIFTLAFVGPLAFLLREHPTRAPAPRPA